MTFHICILFLIVSKDLAMAREIKTYFLNKAFALLKPFEQDKPDIECLKAEGQFTFPSEISFCFRSKPMSNVNLRHPGSFTLGFGTLLENDIEMREGFIYGPWDTGVWMGVKQPVHDSYNFFGGGLGEGFHFQVVPLCYYLTQ